MNKEGIEDPIDGSIVPWEWLEKSELPADVLVDGVRGGRLIVLRDGTVLRRGLSTGTTAAAAAKAAILSTRGEKINRVGVPTPAGPRVVVDVDGEAGIGRSWKDAGDHERDVTDGMEFMAMARKHSEIEIRAGAGIGLVMRDGLPVDKGEPAINPGPKRQIRESIREALDEVGFVGARVTIAAPRGSEIAKKTLNQDVGVLGGISILGSTGFVEPWDDHLGEHVMDAVREVERVVLTTGRRGLAHSKRLFPDHEVVMIGNNIGEALDAAKGDVVICGLPALILKWACPDILRDTGYSTVGELVEKNPEHQRIDRGLRAVREKAGCRVVLLNRDGSILRDTR